MGLRIATWGLLCSLGQSQFFSPSFALSAVPIPLAFPTGFVSQSLIPLAPAFSGSLSTSKKANPGVYNPFPSARDPAADQTLTNLVTSFSDKRIDGKKEEEAKALFDQDSFRSFNIEMEPQNIAIMSQDPTKELKVHCRLTVDYNTANAKVFNDFGVGCGYKGSVGSLRVCLDENHRDNHICRKLSIRVDARAFKSNTPNSTKAPLFYGMRTLMFSGMAVDLSLMSERTSYYLMNTLGITGPMATHAKLFLNGKYLGVYGFVQAVDQEFTEIHWRNDDREGKGGLFKELWFNPLHMQSLDDAHEGGEKADMAFMREVMSAIQSTPLSGNAPQQFFDRYFDEKSFVDMTAFNTLVGNSDDWRQRHNFYLYVRQDMFGKKLVWIPWDYDRLYDSGSETRGALKGKPWWDISSTATPTACNQVMKSAHQQANELGGTPAKIAWNRGIFEQFPLDINIPVTCDKLTQLMAHALASKVRQRTRELAPRIDMNLLRSKWNAWSAQIKTALERDPSGPAVAIMLAQQRQLEQHLTNSIQKAVNQANLADGVSSFGTSSFGASSFSPFGTSSFSPFGTSSFSPFGASSFSASPFGTSGMISTLPSFAPQSTTFPATTFAPVSSFTPFSPAANSFSTSFAPASAFTTSTFAPPSTFAMPSFSMGVIG